MSADLPIFEVHDRDSGGSYAVYADGRVTGFSQDCTIINRIPAALAAARESATAVVIDRADRAQRAVDAYAKAHGMIHSIGVSA